LSRELRRYYEPLRLPSPVATLSFPYTHRSVASPPPQTGLQHWAVRLPEHADPATPGVDWRYFRYSSAHPAAFPFSPQGRLLHFVYEATHGFTCVTACSLAVWKLTTPCCHGAAPTATGAHGQLPGRDFNPLDLLLLLRTDRPRFSGRGLFRDRPRFSGHGCGLRKPYRIVPSVDRRAWSCAVVASALRTSTPALLPLFA
jgi:hypothetical protein